MQTNQKSNRTENQSLQICARLKPGETEGFKSPEENGLKSQSAWEALSKLGKVAVTGGIGEVFIYVTKLTINKITAELDKKYSIKSKAAEWGKKVVNRAKARTPHTLLSLLASPLVGTAN